MSSFCDLNLNVTNLPDKLIDQLVEQAIRLGYDHLALSVDFEFPQVAKDQGTGPNKGNKKSKETRQAVNIPQPKSYRIPKPLQERLDSCARRVRIYSRLTVKIRPADINTQLHHLRSKTVQSYDLIALEPLDNQVLLYLCANNFNADIISVSSGIECKLIDKHLMRPLRNAVNSFSLRFELNYASSISSSTQRRDFIMAGRCLAFNVKSKGLIISSGCSNRLSLRGPYEVLNLTKLFDIKDSEAHRIARATPHEVLTNSFCRKHTASGMVYLKDVDELKTLESALIKLKEKCSNEDSTNQKDLSNESPSKRQKKE